MARPIIAVTGAGGFVGSHLVQHLRAGGHRVLALRRGSVARMADDEGEFDLTCAAHGDALVAQGFRADVIIHLAGRVEIALQPDPADASGRCRPAQARLSALYAANVLGTAHVVDLARSSGAQRIIFASSQAVYGYGENGEADESTPLRPLEHYAASKVAAERLLETAAAQGLTVVVLRFPGIFAPDRLNGAVHAMCRSAVERRVITVTAECAIPFDVLALEDLLAGFTAAVGDGGEGWQVFNLSTGESCSLELLARRIAALVPGTAIHGPAVAQPALRLHARRAAQALNWRAAPLDERLNEVLRTVRP